MKLFAALFSGFILLAAIGCNSKSTVKNSAVINIPDGRNKMDTLRYTCDSCDKYLSQQGFDAVINQATQEAKARLNNPLSFVPTGIDLIVRKADSLRYFDTGKKVDSCVIAFVTYTCIGKNAYGVESEAKNESLIYLINDRVTDMEGKLKKDPLAIDASGSVSRTLKTYDDAAGYIDILPALIRDGKAVSLIVNTSQSCVDKGAMLDIELENGTSIKATNWNDFNCKGVGYYALTDDDIAQLKASRLKYLIFTGDKQISTIVPHNDSDYFMQWLALIKR